MDKKKIKILMFKSLVNLFLIKIKTLEKTLPMNESKKPISNENNQNQDPIKNETGWKIMNRYRAIKAKDKQKGITRLKNKIQTNFNHSYSS